MILPVVEAQPEPGLADDEPERQVEKQARQARAGDKAVEPNFGIENAPSSRKPTFNVTWKCATAPFSM